ncbi:Bifunctional inhibitor/plant lipid transfer protein/seed storage helical domain superfamily [Arabidopsis suecica]|uniref:Bifunctional inhibitor/plant lipid transfer protein/seed storage helical domain superfamily n=1 Tax=Arabidopsis suecica TaxID=45249 RepID=A0A8T2AIZ8_ARASU|nr:Bifunctional inhibitor/plant lipid transfer protein/seed storage helical domain superfamily [Arabidopsis suecica]
MLTANILAVLFLLTLCSGQTPPAPEPVAADGPSSPANCLVSMLNVSDCFSYVQVGSNEIKPEPACCPELAGMVQSSPECVCNLLGGGASPRFGVKLDKQRAEQLSTICGVKAPSPSLCSVLGFPTISPAGSEDSSAGSEGSDKDKKNGAMNTRDYGVALNSLALILLFTFLSLF